ncbi:sigma-70 family RNA polymerase sigma factor [Alicyclobacillaceae bacterium I2511]|nr:sigma-70 family RNA polymerase sigma factor [Alicyclobacillaceae bacterium I2511]
MFALSVEQNSYIRRLAFRYVQFRKSGSIDVDDLISAAAARWWEFCIRHPDLQDEVVLKVCFYQQTKGAMKDVTRQSAPLKVTRTMQAQMQAYQGLARPYTVDLDHAVDVQVGDLESDPDLWMDVVNSLRRLPERERLILSLYFEQGLNYSEIAEVCKVAVSTVTRAYGRAIATLKKDLQVTLEHAKNSPV